MAVDAFIWFTQPKDGVLPDGESMDAMFKDKKPFEIKEFSFDIENPSTVSSATSGAGGGKIKFNEFTIKKPTDYASPLFFKNCLLGAHYPNVVIAIRKAGGTGSKPYLEYCFKMVFTTKIEWSGPGDEGPEESITFAYGTLGIRYRKQKETGEFDAWKPIAWSQIKNKPETIPPTDFSGQ